MQPRVQTLDMDRESKSRRPLPLEPTLLSNSFIWRIKRLQNFFFDWHLVLENKVSTNTRRKKIAKVNSSQTLIGIVRLIMLNKIQGVFLGDDIDTAHSVFMCHPIYLVSNFYKLLPKRCRYKLSICHVCKTTYHIYQSSDLRIHQHKSLK